MPNIFTIILFSFTLAVWVLSLEMVCMTPNSIVIVGQPFRLKIVSCSSPNIILSFFFLVANISCLETIKIILTDVRYQA